MDSSFGSTQRTATLPRSSKDAPVASARTAPRNDSVMTCRRIPQHATYLQLKMVESLVIYAVRRISSVLVKPKRTSIGKLTSEVATPVATTLASIVQPAWGTGHWPLGGDAWTPSKQTARGSGSSAVKAQSVLSCIHFLFVNACDRIRTKASLKTHFYNLLYTFPYRLYPAFVGARLSMVQWCVAILSCRSSAKFLAFKRGDFGFLSSSSWLENWRLQWPLCPLLICWPANRCGGWPAMGSFMEWWENWKGDWMGLDGSQANLANWISIHSCPCDSPCKNPSTAAR